MYDEPPDPDPIPCHFCDAELGCGEGCEHCAMAAKLSETEGKLNELRHRLHCRTRNLAWLPTGQAEMAVALETTTRLIEHYGRTGRAEWPSRDLADAARLAAAYYEDLAELADHETAKAAALWSEEQVARLQAGLELRAA